MPAIIHLLNDTTDFGSRVAVRESSDEVASRYTTAKINGHPLILVTRANNIPLHLPVSMIGPITERR